MADVIIRTATARDARAIHRLVAAHVAEGRLLPRTLADVTEHVHRFIVATATDRVVGSAELAPLGSAIAEVRSLVIAARHRGKGVGSRLVEELRHRARVRGFDQLCAFAHDAEYFARFGFVAVPHPSVPEKIETDCRACPLFGGCGQHAMLMELTPLSDSQDQTVRLKADTTYVIRPIDRGVRLPPSRARRIGARFGGPP